MTRRSTSECGLLSQLLRCRRRASVPFGMWRGSLGLLCEVLLKCCARRDQSAANRQANSTKAVDCRGVIFRRLHCRYGWSVALRCNGIGRRDCCCQTAYHMAFSEQAVPQLMPRIWVWTGNPQGPQCWWRCCRFGRQVTKCGTRMFNIDESCMNDESLQCCHAPGQGWCVDGHRGGGEKGVHRRGTRLNQGAVGEQCRKFCKIRRAASVARSLRVKVDVQCTDRQRCKRLLGLIVLHCVHGQGNDGG